MSYYLKITMESGKGSETYQTTVFTQNYTDHTQQITEMQQLFPAVAELIGGKMVAAGQAYIDEGKKKK